MKNEITLRLKCSINEFCNILENKGFKKIDEFLLDDIYYIPKNIDIHKLVPREILKHYILIRDITQYMPIEHKVVKITYKEKNIGDNGDINSQENIDCKIYSVNEGKKLLEAIGYKPIMNIKEKNVVYEKDKLAIAVKDVKNGEKLIEIETVEDDIELDTVEKLKEKINNFQLPLDTSDYFVKKAEIEIKKIL